MNRQILITHLRRNGGATAARPGRASTGTLSITKRRDGGPALMAAGDGRARGPSVVPGSRPGLGGGLVSRRSLSEPCVPYL